MILLLAGCIGFSRYMPLPLEEPTTLPAPELRLVLAGDGGLTEPDPKHDHAGLTEALTASMRAAAAEVASRRVIWLGDNVYEAGIGPRGADRGRSILAAQIAAGPTAADVAFVPGNHDYLQVSTFRTRLLREADLVRSAGASALAYDTPVERWEPPGTDTIVLFIDSERAIEQTYGGRVTTLAAVADAARTGRPLVLLSHHPVASAGTHGQPVGGLRLLDTELANATYRTWATDVVEALDGAPALFVSGHDHSLQALAVERPDGPAFTQVISGSAAKGDYAAEPDGRVDGRPGYAVVDLRGEVAQIRLVVVIPAADAQGADARCVPIAEHPAFQACSRGISTVNLGRTPNRRPD